MTLVQENMLNKVREGIDTIRNQLDWVMYRSEPLSDREFKRIREAYEYLCKVNDKL